MSGQMRHAQGQHCKSSQRVANVNFDVGHCRIPRLRSGGLRPIPERRRVHRAIAGKGQGRAVIVHQAPAEAGPVRKWLCQAATRTPAAQEHIEVPHRDSAVSRFSAADNFKKETLLSSAGRKINSSGGAVTRASSSSVARRTSPAAIMSFKRVRAGCRNDGKTFRRRQGISRCT